MKIDQEVQEILKPINEMAKIADIEKPIGIYVYSDDYNPPHFHIGVSGGDSIRVAIPNVPFDTQEQLKSLVLNEDKSKIGAYQKYFYDTIKILKAPSRRSTAKGMTDLEVLQFLWETYHDTNNWTDVNAIL